MMQRLKTEAAVGAFLIAAAAVGFLLNWAVSPEPRPVSVECAVRSLSPTCFTVPK